MSSSRNNNWFTLFLFFLILALVVGGMYYTSSDNFKNIKPVDRKEFDFSGRPVQPMSHPGQFILVKDKKYTVGRSSFIYKGIESNTIIIDHYLLDLDTEQAYEKRFLKKEAKKEMLLGEGKYQLYSVNKNFLILKTAQEPITPQ